MSEEILLGKLIQKIDDMERLDNERHAENIIRFKAIENNVARWEICLRNIKVPWRFTLYMGGLVAAGVFTELGVNIVRFMKAHFK